MAVGGSPDEVPPVQQEFQAEVDWAAGCPLPLGALDRFAFYDASRAAYAVVASGESRVWGNVLSQKGALPET
jgi:L-fucose mutarotase